MTLYNVRTHKHTTEIKMKNMGGKSLYSQLIATAIIFGAFVVANSAFALSSGGIGGYPANPDPGIQYSDSWFIYNLDTGESKEDILSLQNTSDETQTIKLYPVDSVATGDGNFALRDEKDPREGVGAWIRLSENVVTLGSGQERGVQFTITIPDGASVGEHSGGIILQKTNAPSVDVGSSGASIITRVGIRVYETVPGDLVKKLELATFTVREVTGSNKVPVYIANLGVENKSNVSLKATASLQVTGWGKTAWFPNSKFTGGLFLDFSDITNFFKGEKLENEWSLLRDQKVETNWEWPKPVFGHFVFQAVVHYDGVNGPEKLTSPTVDVWVIPWNALGVIGVVILLLLMWGFFGRMHGSGKAWKEYTIRPGDQLGTIAMAAGISWKKLAKANKLKTPTVIPGQTIRVPGKFPETSTPSPTPKPAATPALMPAVSATPARPRPQSSQVMPASGPATVTIKPRADGATPTKRTRKKKIT